jgi:hypothetical protein
MCCRCRDVMLSSSHIIRLICCYSLLFVFVFAHPNKQTHPCAGFPRAAAATVGYLHRTWRNFLLSLCSFLSCPLFVKDSSFKSPGCPRRGADPQGTGGCVLPCLPLDSSRQCKQKRRLAEHPACPHSCVRASFAMCRIASACRAAVVT